MDAVVGLRVSEADEYDGLDLSQHGESGYNLEEEFPGTVVDGESGLPATGERRPVAAANA